MNLRRRYVLGYIIIFSLAILFVLATNYDDFSRNSTINESNKALIEKHLSEEDRKMLIDDNIKTDKFIRYIKSPNFTLKNYEYYNILAKHTDYSNDEIVKYGNTLANYEFTLGSLEKILSAKTYNVTQLINLASQTSHNNRELEIEYYPNDMLAVSNYKYYIGNYVPDNLVTLNTKYTKDEKEIKLQKKAATQAALLCDAMKLLNNQECGGLKIEIGYVSYELAKNNAKAYPSFVRPGHNDFQLGKSFAFTNHNIKSNPLYLWLKDNSYKFGFVQRFPLDKGRITHVSDQPAVFRYVGIKQAENIHNNNLTIEEAKNNN